MSETSVIPKHVGIILDGNRRWANQNGLPTLEGHRQGAEVFKTIALDAFDKGVRYLTAYVFSTENWSRTEDEVGYLMKLLLKAVEKYLSTFNKQGIKIIMVGRRSGLAPDVLKAVEKAEQKTQGNTKGALGLCFNYGGREELVDAVQSIVRQGTKAEAITAEKLSQHLYAPELPNIDLLIRTSGEQRTSGFMLYRSDYAELYFTDKFWPDFTPADLTNAFNEYARRQRRHGA